MLGLFRLPERVDGGTFSAGEPAARREEGVGASVFGEGGLSPVVARPETEGRRFRLLLEVVAVGPVEAFVVGLYMVILAYGLERKY